MRVSNTENDRVSRVFARNRRIVAVGFVSSLALSLAKLLAGWLGHSYALIADAVESFADVFASFVVWHGLRIAARPADADHPYGHGKAEALAAIFVALFIGLAGIGIAIEAIRLILTPHHTPAAWTLWVLIGVVVLKETLFRVVHRAAQETGSNAVSADAWHHRSDAITSLAAAVGISVALLGGPGWERADGFAALFASGIIVVNGFRLALPPLHELMDAEPPELIAAVRAAATTVAGVVIVEKVLARKSGGRYWVDMHIEVNAEMPVREAHALAHRVKDAIMAALPAVQDVLIHVEPAHG